MMSDYEVTVNNFIHLLKTQPSLFSKEEKTELVELVNYQSDEIKSLFSAIADWCVEHPQVDDALAELQLKEIAVRAPGSPKMNSSIPNYKSDKRTLLNAIQQSSRTAKDDDNNSKS